MEKNKNKNMLYRLAKLVLIALAVLTVGALCLMFLPLAAIKIGGLAAAVIGIAWTIYDGRKNDVMQLIAEKNANRPDASDDYEARWGDSLDEMQQRNDDWFYYYQ